MTELKLKDFEIVYSKIKSMVFKAYEHNNFDLALKYTVSASLIAYHTNKFYRDYDLEEMLLNISTKIFPPQTDHIPTPGKIIFYDNFGNTAVLALQYIRALIQQGVEFMYVLNPIGKAISNQIISEISAYAKGSVFIFENKEVNNIELATILYKVIAEYAPEKILMHIFPWAATDIVVLNSFTNVTKYNINLTDHAFWLTVKNLDYCIEFRNYGATVSYEKRGLEKNQLLMLPYYPIVNHHEFNGFPTELSADKVIIYTGGQLYKIYGEDYKFFKLLERLVSENGQSMVFVSGNGDDRPLRQFIKNRGLEHRIYILGYRNDINEVFKNCDIYLTTYPLTGGLMAQYAAINEKPILSYSDENIQCNYIDGILDNSSENSITITDWEYFFRYAKKLIDDKELRMKVGKENSNRVVTPDKFSEKLSLLLTNNKGDDIKFIDINYQKFVSIYLETENKFTHSIKKHILKHFMLKGIIYFPKVFFKTILTRDVLYSMYIKFVYKLQIKK